MNGHFYRILHMRNLRITLAQVNPTVGDLCGNVDLCIEAAREAAARGSDIVVFPELVLAGYPPEDLLLKPGFRSAARTSLERFAAGIDTSICAVVGTVDGTGSIYNAAAVVQGGAVRCVYHKMCLPNYGVFDEERYFSAGDGARSFMLGDINIGLSICEDTWIEDGPHCALGNEHGVDVVLNLSASPFHAGKMSERAELLAARSRETDAAFVYVNLVGGQDEIVFDGGSLVFDRKGNCIAKAALFKDELYTVDLTFDTPVSVGKHACVHLEKPGRDRLEIEQTPCSGLSEEEEIFRALVTGTRDYIRKNGFSSVVIGLSGGIDSALVAAVAVEALGKDHVIGVTMPSKYTSTGTRSDAEELAANLGIRFIELPIMPVFDSFIGTLSGEFEGCEPDVTEENIQARIRGTLLMGLSNKFGWLVLTTGNKSEMATGYATLYGDMAGGFAVIKDVPKLMVYRISRMINDSAGREIIPETTIERPPTAELRDDQKDSDSLPPYEVLDPILKAYIEDDMGVEAIVKLGFDRETVKRIARLCDLSEYKRRQAPPGVKITPRAFGRDRRLPITNRFRP